MYAPATIDPRWRLKRQKSQAYNIPAPTGGLNVRDSYTDMKPDDAVKLVNVFPEANYCRVRGGYTSWATGMTNPVRSLMTWNGLTGSDELFAGAGTTIYDVTASGAASSSVTGLTNVDFQWTNIKTPGGIYLIIVNGADSMRAYDGTVWTTPAITVATSSTFINVCQFKERLWFAQKDTLDLWYLPVQSIAGAATLYPMGAVFRRGGYIIGLGTFSNDAGEGPDDYFAIVTNNGEVAVYQGTDPSSSTTWALVGRFDVGMPIGRRCTVRLNGDMGIITQDGMVSMQAALQFDRASIQKATITGKIQTLFSQLSQSYKANFGWSPCVFPKARYMIVNVPQITSTTQIQLVMNTITGSWCQFTGMNAGVWGVANDALFFGGNAGVVYAAESGHQDNGANIDWALVTSWQQPGGPTNKQFKLVRPTLQVGSGVQYGIAINVDFIESAPSGAPPAVMSAASGSVWPWTWPGTWGGQSILDSRWQSTGVIGNWAAISMAGVVRDGPCTINSFDVVAEKGGPL
jgi:hypothetical protein